jgi:hypothetical protein
LSRRQLVDLLNLPVDRFNPGSDAGQEQAVNILHRLKLWHLE